LSAPFHDLRSYLAWLEADGGLRRVPCEVDKDEELACLARWAMECTPAAEQYGMLFENVRGHDAPVALHLFATHDRYAAALGVQREGMLARWSCAMREPLAPQVVADAPAYERVSLEPDLSRLPIPVWTPGRDAGPYIPSAVVITKHPQTGVQNCGTYRIQVHDRATLGVFFGSRLQHGARHHALWTKARQPTPVALAIGVAPAIAFAAAAKTAYGIDEMGIAGALMGAAAAVVGGKTVDLLVPATAEIVIEGVIDPTEMRPEGPFGEALGHMYDAAPAPVIRVTAICHRERPIFHGYVQQLPPSDGHIVMEMGVLGPLWHYLTDKLGLTEITDLAIAPGSAGVAALVVQLAPSAASRAASIGRTLAKLNFGQKVVYLVDDDVDVRDAETINWALSARVDPARDIALFDKTATFQPDPAVLRRAATDGRALAGAPYECSLCVVDATVKCDVPEVALPGAARMQAARDRWHETGLPPLRPRPRLSRLLARHSESDLWRRRPS